MAKRTVCPHGCGKEWVGTSNRRAKTPLDPGASAAANNASGANCERLKRFDGSIRSLTMSDDDYTCRRVWMDAYLEAFDKKKPKKDPPKPKVKPEDPVMPCVKGRLVVQVQDFEDKPIQDAVVDVRDLGGSLTDKDGLADYGEVPPGSYDITAEKDHHSPARDQPHGPVETTDDVRACTTTLVTLSMIQTCTSYHLNKPFLIAQATDSYLTPTNPVSVNDDLLNGGSLLFGQDTTHSSGRTPPAGESVGVKETDLVAKMNLLLDEFASGDTTGMAKRLFGSFLSKNAAIVVFIDPALDKAISTHANFLTFANRALAAPKTPGGIPAKPRIHQALESAGWDINTVKAITDLGVPAFNLGDKVLRTQDYDNGLGVMINGVQYVLVYVEAYDYYSCTQEYKIKLKFALYDVFGLDDDDLTEYGAGSDSVFHSDAAKGVTAWWQLQHQFDYQPLLTRSLVVKEYIVSTSQK